MPTTDGSKQIDPDAGDGPRRARTAAEQRAGRASGSSDPEVLAEEIERTREELAETLDAIADKVSPKRVTARTKQKVSDAVHAKTDAAKEQLSATASSAKETATHAKEQLQDKVEHVKEQVQDKASGSDDTLAVVEPAGADLPPVAPLATAPGGVTTYGASPAVPKEVLVGGAAAVAVVLLLLGRRRRQRNRGWKTRAKR